MDVFIAEFDAITSTDVALILKQAVRLCLSIVQGLTLKLCLIEVEPCPPYNRDPCEYVIAYAPVLIPVASRHPKIHSLLEQWIHLKMATDTRRLSHSAEPAVWGVPFSRPNEFLTDYHMHRRVYDGDSNFAPLVLCEEQSP